MEKIFFKYLNKKEEVLAELERLELKCKDEGKDERETDEYWDLLSKLSIYNGFLKDIKREIQRLEKLFDN